MSSAYGTDDIWDVFDDSVVRVRLKAGWHTYGVDPIDLAEPAFGVTGWNPGKECPRSANEAANLRLGDRLGELGIDYLDAVGESPDGSWSEPGFVLVNTDRATALAIGREFGQLAIHELADGQLRVLRCGTDS